MAEQAIKPVRWGIISTASIACSKIIPALQASACCELVAVSSRDQSRAEACAREFGIARAYGSYEAMLDDPDIEAVYVPLPNHLHVDMVLAATARGKHVLCEKPIALDAEDARRLLDIPPGLIVAEAFMVRHHPQWVQMREVLRSGRYGAVRAVQAMLSFRLDKDDDFRFHPEFGGGALYDLGCYTAMTMRYVYECEPRRVFCALVTDPETGVDIQATAILDFGAGQQACFTVGLKMAAAQHLQVVCEHGMLDLPAPYVPTPGAPARLLLDSHDGLDDCAPQVQDVPVVEQYSQEVTNFALAVRGEQEALFGIQDAIGQMQVIDALFISARSGTWQSL